MTPAKRLAAIQAQNDEESPTFAMCGDSWYCDLCDQVINEGGEHDLACERGQIRWLLAHLARQQAVVEAASRLSAFFDERALTLPEGFDERLAGAQDALAAYQQDGGK